MYAINLKIERGYAICRPADRPRQGEPDWWHFPSENLLPVIRPDDSPKPGVYFSLSPLFPKLRFRVPALVATEELSSPYEPDPSAPVWQPDAGRWAAAVPDARPGGWARGHVEAPAMAVREKNRCLRSLRETWGASDKRRALVAAFFDRSAVGAALK